MNIFLVVFHVLYKFRDEHSVPSAGIRGEQPQILRCILKGRSVRAVSEWNGNLPPEAEQILMGINMS